MNITTTLDVQQQGAPGADVPTSVPDLAERLATHGYWVVPIPAGQKFPEGTGWQRLRLTPEECAAAFADAALVGVLHLNNVVFDVDILDPDLSAKVRAEARRRFPGALERVGQAPKSSFWLRMEEPGFRVSNTTKRERIDPTSGEVLTAQVEVRSLTRQAVAYGLHPTTGQPYRWVGRELWATPWADLPEAHKDEVQAFRDWCDEQIAEWAGEPPKATEVAHRFPKTPRDGRPSEAAFLAALRSVPSSLDHESGWLECLMGIHDFYTGSARGLDVAKEWSSGDVRYSAQEVEAKWRSFGVGKGVSYRSVFHHAHLHGADLAQIGRMDRPEWPRSHVEPPPHLDAAPPPTEEDARLDAEPDDEPSFGHHGPSRQVRRQTSRQASKDWTIQTAAEFTAGFVPPEFIIQGIVRRGYFYLLTAPTGAGKTAVMLYASTALSRGVTFADREVEQGDVLFLVGENPDDVRARFIATMEAHGIDPAQCRVHFIAGTFSVRQDMALLQERAASLPNLVLVVIDTFAAFFDGDDENSNAQAVNFAQLVRQITEWPSRPAVIMPAHPVKNATRQNLIPKGGSSLLNECDGNLTLWAEENISTLHCQGKFRGPEFEPLKFELEKYTTDRLRDHKGNFIPTVLAKPLLETRARQIAVQTLRDEDRLLLNVRDLPGQSFADRAVELGLKMTNGRPYKMRVQRLLEKLEKQKLVRRFRDIWELTKEGERAVEMIQRGGFAPQGGL